MLMLASLGMLGKKLCSRCSWCWPARGRWAKDRPADAHDAGLFGGVGRKIVQLMLMMLAHDAGLFGDVGQEAVQRMLVMLVFLGVLSARACS